MISERASHQRAGAVEPAAGEAAPAATVSLPATATPAPAEPGPEPWRGEERLVREAVMLVAIGGAPRVLVAGLQWGEPVLDALRRPALTEGVRLLARATARPDRIDIVVEPLRP